MAASQSPKQKVNMLPDTPISVQLLWSREGLQLGWRVKKPSSELREAYCLHTPCEPQGSLWCPEDSGQSAHLPRVPLLTLLGASVMWTVPQLSSPSSTLTGLWEAWKQLLDLPTSYSRL